MIDLDTVTIVNVSEKNEKLEATFTPSHGMNLLSYKKNGLEVIDQSTWGWFEERNAGLGALIGPHFYHRTDFPQDFDHSLFPHLAHGSNAEPFSHGLGRYSSWKYDSSETQISANLKGSHLLHGIPLKNLQGMDFDMHFEAVMMPYGLFIRYYINSELPSVLGLHYYYHLPKGIGSIESTVMPKYNDKSTWKDIPNEWLRAPPSKMHFDLQNPSDFGFRPLPSEKETRILLDAKEYELHIIYDSSVEENSWQLWHPENSSFVCIEPLTAKDPRQPHQKHSLLEVKLEIFS